MEDYEEDRRYFTRLPSAEVTYCTKCAGYQLSHSIETGGESGVMLDEDDHVIRVTVFHGINDEQFIELTPDERQSWRDTNLQFDGRPWVCEHEMQEVLRTRVC